MPKLNVEVPHNLAKDEALRRIKNMLTDLKNEHGDKISNLEESWSGNSGNFKFTAMGMKLAGTIDVTDSQVAFNGDLPLAAALFKGRAENMIEEKAKELLR